MLQRTFAAMFAVGVLTSACAKVPSSPLSRQVCFNPDAQLAALLQPLEALRAKGCDAGTGSEAVVECERLRGEIARLAVVCSGHAPTLMANAVIAYDDHRMALAQQYLDQILARPQPAPDAAALRARIAIEEGNLPFARRLLEQQIQLAPDHAGLREALGSAFYLGGQWLEAEREITMARALGAPAWRIAYHLGLIQEAAHRLDLARQYYTQALEGNPGFAPARSRLNALGAR